MVSASSSASDFAHEAYVSLSIDAAAARIRIMVAADGGVDVEAHACRDRVSSALPTRSNWRRQPSDAALRCACRLRLSRR